MKILQSPGRGFVKIAQVLKRRYWPIHLDALKDPAEAYYGEIYRTHIDHYLASLSNGELAVLDAGCGTGRMTVPLARQGHRVTAVDYHRDSLRKLHQNLAEAGVADRVTVIDRELGAALEDMPGGSYDAVLSLEVLYSSRDLKGMLDVLARRLRSGGVLLASHRPSYYYILYCLANGHVDEALNVAQQQEGALSKGHHRVHYNWQSRKELENLYAGAGMEVLGMHPIGPFSGFGVDPLGNVCDPGELDAEERSALRKLELQAGEEHLMTSRYVLVSSRKP